MNLPSQNDINRDFLRIYRRQADTVYRVCYSFMKNKTDTEDMVQETFLRLLSTEKKFESERHEKAWLIVTASNLCKDNLKNWWRRNENIDDFLEIPAQPKHEDRVLEHILSLDDTYKDVVYLYYYEGYSTDEIGKLLRISQSAVSTRLHRARNQLKQELEE